MYRVTNRRSAAVASNQGVSFEDRTVYKVRGDAAFALHKAAEGMSKMNTIGIVGEHSRVQSVMKVRPVNLEMAGTVFCVVVITSRSTMNDLAALEVPDQLLI